jgi:hypothetical protein
MGYVPLCATKRNDVMGGKPRRLYRQAVSPWGVASGGCKLEVKKLPLKGTREARCKPPRRGAWLRECMVSKRNDEKPTGKCPPASIPCTMGQRPHPMVFPKDDRGWFVVVASPKDGSGQPDVPSARSGFRDERLGLLISRHLNTLAEYIVVNVGGFGMDAEVSSPPMTSQSVGGPIVVGAWESRVHGEGGQGIDAVLV